MLTLAGVTAHPELLYRDVRLRDGTPLLYRPLLPEDAPALADFLTSLSPLTRQRWTLDSYDRVMAEALCEAIGRYDKLRLVAVEPDGLAGTVVALFEFSFGIPPGDHERFAAYGIGLDEASDCRFGPCVRDAYQRRGVGSALMGPTFAVAQRFGKGRVILWGGVLADNRPALAFYQRHGFDEVGRFSDKDGIACVDMVRVLEDALHP
jgi:diamine N-acetyltransferase